MLAKLWIFLLFCLNYGSCANLTKSFQEVNGTINGNLTFNSTDGPYLVTSELVVAHNATLTIEAGSEVVFVPTVGLRVHGSLHARGTHLNRTTFRALPCNETVFCNNTNLDRFYNPGIKLVGGTSHSNGRLEIQRNGQWGTICNYANRWDYKETTVACRQLGFLGAKRYYTYPGSGPVHMRDVYCNGKEETLWDCGYSWSSCCELSLVQSIGNGDDNCIPILVFRELHCIFGLNLCERMPIFAFKIEKFKIVREYYPHSLCLCYKIKVTLMKKRSKNHFAQNSGSYRIANVQILNTYQFIPCSYSSGPSFSQDE